MTMPCITMSVAYLVKCGKSMFAGIIGATGMTGLIGQNGNTGRDGNTGVFGCSHMPFHPQLLGIIAFHL